jgi:hypothetical protein
MKCLLTKYGAAVLLATLAPGLASKAQCVTTWIPPSGASLNWGVHALRSWDRDGIEFLLAGGNFTLAGGIELSHVGIWDGADWIPMGTGVNGTVPIISLFQFGSYPPQPVVGGGFGVAGGVPAHYIARWDGWQWHPLGSGLGGTAFPHADAMIQYGPDLFVAGVFTSAGGIPAYFIAAWDGLAWRAVPDRAANAQVFTTHQGQLIAGGHFADPGAPYPYTSVLRYTGSGWANVGTDPPRDNVVCLATYQGRLVAGGYFNDPTVRVGNIAILEGDAWQSMGSGMNGPVLALCTFDPDGPGPLPELLIAGGEFTTAGGQPASRIAAWDGSQWMPLGSGANGGVRALAVYNNQLAVGGYFTTAGSLNTPFFALWGCPQPAPCYANCDQSTSPPFLTVADFSCFLQQFAAGNPYANCDQSTTPPTLNIADFACFLHKFAAGCP